MRERIIAGNWKMNCDFSKGKTLVEEICAKVPDIEDGTKLVVCPPFIHLEWVAGVLEEIENVYVGAQNFAAWEKGAYTGEISAAMLKSVGAKYVIIGHSERREYFKETEETLAQKVNLAIQYGLVPIYCCGEKLEVREANNHFTLIEKQISEGLFHLSKDNFTKIAVAYEPVWAIGTGKVATPTQAQEMHAFIREKIESHYTKESADTTTILYGGSVKPSNALQIFENPDVDGGLIGGASLSADDFLEIYNALVMSTRNFIF